MMRHSRPHPDAPYVPPPKFVAWLNKERGRAEYFSKIDPCLFQPLVAKMKSGSKPITFEYAIRLERAQKPSDNPIRAIDLMTFQQDRELYLYATGQMDAPEKPAFARKNSRPFDKEPAQQRV